MIAADRDRDRDMDDTGGLAHKNTSLKRHSTSYTVWAPDAQLETLAISSF